MEGSKDPSEIVESENDGNSERDLSSLESIVGDNVVSSSESGTLEDSFERDRKAIRGGIANVFCFVVASSASASSVKALLMPCLSRGDDDGDDDGDGKTATGTVVVGVFG